MEKYRDKILNWSDKHGKTSMKWTELQELLGISDYIDFSNTIKKLVDLGVLKSMGYTLNGRKPSLYSKYRIIKEDVDYSNFIHEIDYIITPKIDKSYLKKNMKYYIENRNEILKISSFILNNSDRLKTAVSINERSFQIFGKEKQLKKSKSLLKRLNIPEEFFNYYETSEPIAYYSLDKKTPQNILIIENKDTFYTMRKYIKEEKKDILGLNISTIIYGGGKSKIPSLSEFKYYTEDYISCEENNFYYFGDIDYEGIVIYESYRDKTSKETDLIPFVPAYEFIVDKCLDSIDDLPTTKDGQNRNIGEVFFKNFNDIYKNRIINILEKNKYIPQEALNYEDLIHFKNRR